MVKSQKKKTNDETAKIIVGTDDFCSNCMEWREYDENGKCKVCGKLIITMKNLSHRNDYEVYDLGNISDLNETDEDNSY